MGRAEPAAVVAAAAVAGAADRMLRLLSVGWGLARYSGLVSRLLWVPAFAGMTVSW